MKNIFLNSFARSGSNIISLILQHTLECNIKGEAIAYTKNLFVNPTNLDLSIYKTHRNQQGNHIWNPNHKENIFEGITFNYFILVLRNPFDAIIRHNEIDVKMGLTNGDKWWCGKTEEFINFYNNCITEYNNFDGPKYTIYYEDFMDNPGGEITKICNHFNFPIVNNPNLVHEKISKKSKQNHKFVSGKSTQNNSNGIPNNILERYLNKLLKDEKIIRYTDDIT